VLDRETLALVMEQLKPVAGEIKSDRATVPVKPLSPLTVIVDVLVTPASTVTLVESAAIVKSTTWNRMLPVVWDRLPLVPVTVTM
jgi:hypothetical protein